MKTPKSNKGKLLIIATGVVAILGTLAYVIVPKTEMWEKRLRNIDSTTMENVTNELKRCYNSAASLTDSMDYVIPNNYTTYTDSNGLCGKIGMRGEYWAPDGIGQGMTITFNPNEKGEYVFARAFVNDMTRDNGSIGTPRATAAQQCPLKDVELGDPLAIIEHTLGYSVKMRSNLYKNSSYTVFIMLDSTTESGISVYGSFNGILLDEQSWAAIGSNTDSYDHNGMPVASNPGGGRTAPNFDASWLEPDIQEQVPTEEPEDTTPTVITFKIADTEYQGLSDMTFEDWVNSEYNVDGFSYYGDGHIVRVNSDNPEKPVLESIMITTQEGLHFQSSPVYGVASIASAQSYSKRIDSLEKGILIMHPTDFYFMEPEALKYTTNEDVVAAMREGKLAAVATSDGIFSDADMLETWFEKQPT